MDIHPLAFSVVVEMVSQMGMESVSGFKNFLDALEEGNMRKLPKKCETRAGANRHQKLQIH